MKRVRTRLGAAMAAVALGATALAAMGGTAHALGNPAHPQLTFDHIITSHPWTGTTTNAIDIEGLGYVAADTSMWVADDNGDRVWEIDPTTGALKSFLRGGNPSTNPANVDFLTATNVSSGKTCGDPSLVDPTLLDVTGTTQVDSANYECLSRTDDFESAVFDPGPTAAISDDALYVTSGNCCTAGFPAVYLDSDNNPLTPPTLSSYPYHPTVWKLTRDGSGHFKPSQWQSLPEGTDPTAAGLRPGGSIYFGHSKKVQTYDFASNALGSDATLPVATDIVGLVFTDANTAFVTTATPNVAVGRTTANSDSTIQRFDVIGSTWTANATWKFPLKSIGVPGGPVDDDGMIDARDLAIVSSGGVDKFYVSDGYDSRVSNDHPIYVYNLVDAPPPPPPPTGPAWHYELLNGAGSLVTNHHFDGGNTLLQYGTQLHAFYRDTTSSSLDHSWWDGAKWNYEQLDTSGGSVGKNVTSIVYNGQLQLFYTDSTGTHLTHRWWDGAKWNSEAFDATKSAGSGTIVVKLYGTQLQLFYANDSSNRLRHSWYDGAWHSEDLDTGTALPSSNTSVDASKYGATLQVVYKTSASTLRHSWYDAGWHSETLDGSAGSVSGVSRSVGDYAQLQSFGTQLDILYRDASANGLRHAWWNGAKWSFELLDGNGGNISGHTNDSVGAYIQPMQYAGGLHVWYHDLTSGALRHAWYAGGWHVEILDGSGATKPGASNSANTGLFIGLVDYFGQIQLTYLDAGNADRLAHSWYS